MLGTMLRCFSLGDELKILVVFWPGMSWQFTDEGDYKPGSVSFIAPSIVMIGHADKGLPTLASSFPSEMPPLAPKKSTSAHSNCFQRIGGVGMASPPISQVI